MVNDQYSKKKRFWDKTTPRIRSDLLVNPSIIKLLGMVKKQKILDIGCGNGYLSAYFADKGAIITGVDISRELIELARCKQGNYVVGDARNLKFSPNSYDKAYSSMVFLHLSDRDILKAFKEAYRVLKNKGVFIISDIHPNTSLSTKKSKLVQHQDREIDYFITKKVHATLLDLDSKTFDIEYYHRPVSVYLNSASKAGFRLEEVIEPKPTKDQLNKFRGLLEVENKQPSYIIFKFRKE